MKKKEHLDPGGRKLVLWDKLPGKLSISAPGEGGFIFLADKTTAFALIADLCEWYNEQRSGNDETMAAAELPVNDGRQLRGGIDE
jgi:hypothetical protein